MKKIKNVSSGVAEETFIALCQANLQFSMTQNKLTKQEVAKRVGCKANDIKTFLSGKREITLREFATLMWACNREIEPKTYVIERYS